MGGRLGDDERARRRAEAARRAQRQRRLAVAALGTLTTVIALIAALSLRHGGDLPELGSSEASATDTVAATRPGQPAATGRQAAGGPPPRAAEPAAANSEPPGHALPILMYHVTEAPPAGTPFPELWVAPERFAEQMEAIESAGYHAVTMRDAEDYWAGKRRVPRKPIVLTFDDGYRSHVAVALPELRRRGWPGVLYLEVAALKKPGAEGIGKAGVRQLIDAGWELGAHTMTHPDLTAQDTTALTEEVAGSRRALQSTFGVPVDAFCYPAGKYDDAVVAEVGQAGYRSATTVEPGLAGPDDTPFTRHRIRVNGSDSGATVVANIAAAGG